MEEGVKWQVVAAVQALKLDLGNDEVSIIWAKKVFRKDALVRVMTFRRPFRTYVGGYVGGSQVGIGHCFGCD